jgi:hypothetical protein
MMRWVKDTRKRERPPPEKNQNWEYTTAPPCNSKKSVAVIPEPLPSPEEVVVDSASENSIDESEGRKKLMRTLRSVNAQIHPLAADNRPLENVYRVHKFL